MCERNVKKGLLKMSQLKFSVQIEFPLPDRRQKRLIFQACTAKMNLSDDVNLEVCSLAKHRKVKKACLVTEHKESCQQKCSVHI